jgi:hypothetical protein
MEVLRPILPRPPKPPGLWIPVTSAQARVWHVAGPYGSGASSSKGARSSIRLIPALPLPLSRCALRRTAAALPGQPRELSRHCTRSRPETLMLGTSPAPCLKALSLWGSPVLGRRIQPGSCPSDERRAQAGNAKHHYCRVTGCCNDHSACGNQVAALGSARIFVCEIVHLSIFRFCARSTPVRFRDHFVSDVPFLAISSRPIQTALARKPRIL